LAATAAVTTGWGVAASVPASAQCAFIVVRHDRAYFLYGAHGPSKVRPGEALRDTLEPGCSDVAGVPAPAPTRVKARRIAGVSPDVAVLVHGQVLVNMGYLPQTPGFPVPGLGDRPKRCRSGVPASLTGAAHFFAGGIQVAAGGRPSDVYLDARTRVTGLTRRGLPYIGEGQRVRIDAVHCGRELVARRIVANGPIVPEATAEDILGQDWRGQAGVDATARSYAWWAAAAAAVAVALTAGLLVLRRRPGAAHRS
jgi:hypothetical protein